jgi:hypothetical protein
VSNKNILLTNENVTHLFSDNTTSITVHLPESKYINIITADKKHIIDIEDNEINIYDESETLIKTITL